MTLIMGTVLTSQSTYSEGTLLNNTAVDASLIVRQAQVSGVSVREFQPGTGDFDSAYGAMFQRGLGYYFFADRGSKNGIYDGDAACTTGSNNECLQEKDVPSGVSVSSICSISTSDIESCNIGRVDITFVRPNVDARFVFWDLSINPMAVSSVKGVRITFHTAASGLNKSIVVYTTGQISIQ